MTESEKAHALKVAETEQQIKKRACCPPLQAEVEIYNGLFDPGMLTVEQQSRYNRLVAAVLVDLVEGREAILAGRPWSTGEHAV